MGYGKLFSSYLACAASCCVLIACSGGGGSSSVSSGSSSSGDSTGSTTQLSIQQRSDAATKTATTNQACTSITPFYWEIGDKNGLLASGNGGDNSTATPNAGTAMLIASASKWIFSTYAVEKRNGVLSVSDLKLLNFESGYTNFSSCSSFSTVSSCLSEPGNLGGTNGDYFPATDGRFFYNGGHMQMLASNLGLGPDYNPGLASDIESIVGSDIAISYIEPQLAGGVRTTPTVYAKFLRNMLSAKYAHMFNLLGSNAVCTHTNSADCPSALYSPVNQSVPGPSNDVSDEKWHYSLGHWVEDDPVLGDGSFSSPGRFGFYPWIDKSKTYYGILARYDPIHVGITDPKQASYITSVDCGRLIRSAWINGKAP